jgi:vanillate O-demethylase ferredoxin subunit
MTTTSNDDTIQVRVKSITYEAEDVISLDLRPVAAGTLPAFTAGAHVELRLSKGLARNYSLANAQNERHRYCVAVQKDPASRGGSRFIHETIRAGDVLPISPPRNNFALVEESQRSVLIAGGIGITPIWCMMQRLVALGRRWELFYAVRSRGRAAFIDEILALDVRQVHLHVDDESAGALIDLDAVVQSASAGTHFYCCGPLPMLAAFERATASLPAETVHVEYFTAKQPVEASGGFDVVLARSGRTVFVPEHATILDALLAAGVDAGHSCLEGVCGTCETNIIEGIPDHRDVVLSAQERASNRTMMICCSGSKTGRLVLDL